MCTVCGCGTANPEEHPDARSERDDHAHDHSHAGPHDHHHHGHEHDHDHGRGDHHHHDQGQTASGEGLGDHQHAPIEGLDYGAGAAGVAVPGLSQARIIRIERDILGENDRLAAANRAWLARRGILALNLVSSPGSGKTTLLVRTINDLAGRMPMAVPMAVIEGDQQTSVDAERIGATGVAALQINTGKGCHLDARMIGDAFGRLGPHDRSLLFIENVGNLVCPAAFDLGEAHKVVMLSVTEGDDKPLKYPDMFHASDLMLLTKIDLLAYVSFDVERCVSYARRINPKIETILVSATSGAGLGTWYDWIDRHRQMALVALPGEGSVAEAGG